MSEDVCVNLNLISENDTDDSFSESDDLTELFEAAKNFDKDKLITAVSKLNNISINTTKNCNTAILYALVHGDVTKSDFYQCVDLLVNADIDVTRCDLYKNTPLECVKKRLKAEQNPQVAVTLAKVADLLRKRCREIEKRSATILSQSDIGTTEEYCSIEGKLLEYMLQPNTKKFEECLKKVSNFINYADNEHTLLQLACRSSEKFADRVRILLDHGADPNQVGKYNKKPPLEIACAKVKIFQELIQHERIQITQAIFNNLMKLGRRKVIKCLLISNKLDVNVQSTTSKNTPLHYAILFNQGDAIERLLKRGASLTKTNSDGRCCLDIINSKDLETYLDSCTSLDNYKNHISDCDYKLHLNFTTFIDSQSKEELDVVNKMQKSSNLQRLICHPLTHCFLSLKWRKAKRYFWLLVLIQLTFLLALFVLFYIFDEITCKVFSVLNILKTLAFCGFCLLTNPPKKWRLKFVKDLMLDLVQHVMFLHLVIEIAIGIIAVLISFSPTSQKYLHAFIFVLIAISILLTLGYHYNLSRWSIILQKTFKRFLLFFSLFFIIIVAFSAGFDTLLRNDASDSKQNRTRKFSNSLFNTYIMTTGDFDFDEEEFADASIARYLFLALFTATMLMVSVNFLTGVVVADVASLEQDAQLGVLKTVIAVLVLIETFFPRKKLLFDEKSTTATTKMYRVDFYINKLEQFNAEGVPKRVDDKCTQKFIDFYNKKH